MEININTVQSLYNAKDCVISDSCYKGTILQQNYSKMTIKWSFSFNSIVKFHGQNIW